MKFIKKIIPSLLILVFLSVGVSAEVVDRIVAVVNEEIVTLSEFNAAFEPYVRHIEESYKGPDKEKVMEQNKRMFLMRYVDNMLIEQEAKKSYAPITVKDEEVMSALMDILSKRQTNMDDFVRGLAKEGKTLEMVKKEIRSQMVRMRLLRREVQSNIIVSDEEIGEYYNQHREDYEGKEAVHIKEIFLKYPTKANKAVRAQVKNEAYNLRKRIEKGEPFELIAAKYSQGAAAAQGGDIGFVERGVVLPELESVIFNLSVGKLSAPIETDSGVYIVVVLDKRGAGLKPFDVVRQEIKAKLEEEKLEKKYDDWISSIRKKSYIDIRL